MDIDVDPVNPGEARPSKPTTILERVKRDRVRAALWVAELVVVVAGSVGMNTVLHNKVSTSSSCVGTHVLLMRASVLCPPPQRRRPI